jgi:hypothetical protein
MTRHLKNHSTTFLMFVFLILATWYAARSSEAATPPAPPVFGGCIVGQAGGGDGALTTMSCTSCTPPKTVSVCANANLTGCSWGEYQPCARYQDAD